MHDIIGKHSDLMAMFNEFLMRCEVGPEDPYTRQYPRDRNRVSVCRAAGAAGGAGQVQRKRAGQGQRAGPDAGVGCVERSLEGALGVLPSPASVLPGEEEASH